MSNVVCPECGSSALVAHEPGCSCPPHLDRRNATDHLTHAGISVTSARQMATGSLSDLELGLRQFAEGKRVSSDWLFEDDDRNG